MSVLSEIDVSNPKALRLVRTLTLDGAYVDARLVGTTARIVVSSQVPTTLPFEQPTDSTDAALATARDHNRAVVQSSGLGSWLPTYRIKRAGRPAQAARPLVQCRNVDRPQRFSGLGMLTVLTVNLAKGLDPGGLDRRDDRRPDRLRLTDNLYLATERWTERPLPETPTVAAGERHDRHPPLRHLRSVPNALPRQRRGVGLPAEPVVDVRVRRRPARREHGRARVVRLERFDRILSDDAAPGDGALNQIGRVGNLGKGQRVYAVRFVGPTGYVVTFKQVDPLYTVDLTDPARPRVLGELELPGYSAYLHPIGADLLLGIGQDVNDQGEPVGTQLSLFDVSDLRHPTRLAHATLGAGWSEAESDPHAFLFWPRTGLVVVPFDQRAVGYRVGRSTGIELVGRITHPTSRERSSAISTLRRGRRQRLHGLGCRRRLEQPRHPRAAGLGVLPAAGTRARSGSAAGSGPEPLTRPTMPSCRPRARCSSGSLRSARGRASPTLRRGEAGHRLR